MNRIVEAKSLVKKYGDQLVVDAVDLNIEPGEIFGILGPNGAGKSSLMKMMYGASNVTSGELFVLGLNAKHCFREIKSRVGVIPQDDALDEEFTVEENLQLFAGYHLLDKMTSQARINDLLRLMRLDEHRHKLIPTLSGGLRRRLSIARGMLNNPAVIFLDEPTSGLDPDVRLWIWEFLEKVRSEMGTIILTTHYMEEAERLCDRIALMEKGKIIATGSPKQLIKARIGHEVVELEVAAQDINYYSARLREAGFKHFNHARTLHVHLQDDQNRDQVLQIVKSSRIAIRKANLNDVFLSVSGHSLGQVL